MAYFRQQKILEIIEDAPIFTQLDLQKKLADAGFPATQATLSRDIKKLGLIKMMDESNKRYYVYPEPPSKEKKTTAAKSFALVIKDAVLSVDFAMQIVVVKCRVGFANAACAAFDGMQKEGVVGTISGDDTFLIVMKNEQLARLLVEQINELLS